MTTPRLARDIFPGRASSFPDGLTAFGNVLVFSANDGLSSQELWRSDGKTDRTKRVADVQPGGSGSFPSGFTAVGPTLFFRADDGRGGGELWKSDGTAAGTVRVADINTETDIRTGNLGSEPSDLTAFGDSLVFSARDRRSGRELWKSDGTTVGTALVADIRPGQASSEPSDLTTSGRIFYFTAQDGRTGRELWKSDGTAAGTVPVADLRPGPRGSIPRELTTIGNTLFFTADDGKRGRQLWKSDGTAAGTSRVTDSRPGKGSSFITQLAAVGNTLFFTADDGRSVSEELWKTDGTAGGTKRVADIRSGKGSSSIDQLTAVGNTLFFTANDGQSGQELWKSDGTAAGTKRVADIRPGKASSFPVGLTAVGNTLFFNARSSRVDSELWTSNGTGKGTMRVADISPGKSGSDPREMTLVENTLFFSANDGSNGFELWALDVPSRAIAPADANKPEGPSAASPFSLTHNGDTSSTSTARWAVRGSGRNRTNPTDFSRGVHPYGRAHFQVQLSSATGEGDDRIVGRRRPELIHGRTGQGTLTGGRGGDGFRLRYGQSLIPRLDRITDFHVAQDKGPVLNRTATKLGPLAADVFLGADGKRAGTQVLNAHAAALVRATNRAIRGTDLLINDPKGFHRATTDGLIDSTGSRGSLPHFGRINADSVFA